MTRILFEELTSNEEEHIDFLEAQLTLIGQLGEALYAQNTWGSWRIQHSVFERGWGGKEETGEVGSAGERSGATGAHCEK